MQCRTSAFAASDIVNGTDTSAMILSRIEEFGNKLETLTVQQTGT